MKLIAALSLLLNVATAKMIQSKPFKLVIESSDKALNGQQFGACHTGAAIESLCLSGGKTGDKFYSNHSEGDESPLKGYAPGVTLVWNLPYNGKQIESEPMVFSYDPSSNVALPLFEPSDDSQPVNFDTEGYLGIFSYLDDTKSPPTTDEVIVLRNWYVCKTNYGGYQYKTLSWAVGRGGAKPQNPNCVKVQVKRKFV